MLNRRRDDVRREADRIETTLDRGQMRRARTLHRTPSSDRLILDAVARAKAGDEDAVRLLYLRYAGNVYAYVCSIVCDEHEAEDVTQLIFAKMLVALPAYEQRVVPFSGWLLRIAHNAAIDHVRARRSVPCAEIHDRETEDHDLSLGRGRDLRDALDALPEPHREVIVLRFLLGLTPTEIARRTGRSTTAVHSLQHRARRTLRDELRRLNAAPATARAVG